MANLPALTPTTFAEAMQFANELAKSTMVPREFQRNSANILVAIQWGAELGLGPLQALQNIAVINGKPSVYGDALLALVRGSPLCEDVIEHIEGEGDKRTAYCEAHRKGAGRTINGKFSVEDAKRAGLWGKTGPWIQYPDRMLQMRARTFALRDAFPDVLRGVITVEEAADIPRDPPKDVTSPQTIAAELDAFAEADMAPDQVEVDSLLVRARNEAQKGYPAFREWYLHWLDDEQRTALKPHIRGLQETARAMPNQGEVDLGLADATDTASAASAQAAESPPDQPMEQGRPEGEPPLIEEIKPVRLRRGQGWDWERYGDDYLLAAKKLPRERLGELRAKQTRFYAIFRDSDRPQWERVEHALTELGEERI